MRGIGFILPVWVEYVVIASILSAPIVFFGRGRVRWYPWEFLVLVLPFALWTVLLLSGLSRKSMANLCEPMWLALGVPLVAMVRVVVGSRIPGPVCAAALIAALCLAASGLFFLVPELPE